MATIVPTFSNGDEGSYLVVQWVNMANGDDGAPCKYVQWADRSVQVSGTFGAGGSVRWEGSNDGTNYVVLTDPQGNNLDFTSAKIETVVDLPLNSRPRVTAGDGTTSVTVTILARRQQPARV